jgi:hypothetical protein
VPALPPSPSRTTLSSSLTQAAEKKLADTEREQAEAALKDALPWFGKVDAGKLFIAITRARAVRV